MTLLLCSGAGMPIYHPTVLEASPGCDASSCSHISNKSSPPSGCGWSTWPWCSASGCESQLCRQEEMCQSAKKYLGLAGEEQGTWVLELQCENLTGGVHCCFDITHLPIVPCLEGREVQGGASQASGTGQEKVQGPLYGRSRWVCWHGWRQGGGEIRDQSRVAGRG
ncbi:caspase-10 [Platysternon megacephalum]|uniref:Caspase-10 n=1 Tax=Platysternon megacephalum TaxID=55544 RepID=A0A4D9EQQ7_9SAUR|nr:caspase-10 [Platysternon megacephalum]